MLRVGGAAEAVGLQDHARRGRGPRGARPGRSTGSRSPRRASPSDAVVVASEEQPGYAMPAAGWAAKSGEPVLWVTRDAHPGRHARRDHRAQAAEDLRARPGVGDLRRRGRPARRARQRAADRGRGPGDERDRVRALLRRHLGLERRRPGPRARVPHDPAAAGRRGARRRSRPRARTGRSCSSPRRTRCPRRCRTTCSTSSPATTRTPSAASTTTAGSSATRTRCRSTSRRGSTRCSRSSPSAGRARTTTRRLRAMAEAEKPDRLDPRHRVTVDDVRQLMGASTPHFALQLRNRIRKLIAGLAVDDPARLLGRAGDRAARAARVHRRGARGAGPRRSGRCGASGRTRSRPRHARASAARQLTPLCRTSVDPAGAGGTASTPDASRVRGAVRRWHHGRCERRKRRAPRRRPTLTPADRPGRHQRRATRLPAGSTFARSVTTTSTCGASGARPTFFARPTRSPTQPPLTFVRRRVRRAHPRGRRPLSDSRCGSRCRRSPELPRRPPRRVRRPGMGARGEQMREEQRDDDLPRELRVRAVTRLDPREPGEHRAGFVTHLHRLCHIRRIPLRPAGSVLTPMLDDTATHRDPRLAADAARGPSASTPPGCASGCGSSPACRSSARSSTCARGALACGSSCATSAARCPCSMWRQDFDALPVAARRRPARRRRGRLRLLPGLARGVAVVLLRGRRAADRRRGRPARPARAAAPRARRRGPVRAAEGAARGRRCRAASAS